MAQLVKPYKEKHKYVVGIDFGHGETSAAICELEWDKSAGTSEQKIRDIDMDRNAKKKVIVSAICKTPNGRYHIGNEAFEPDNLIEGTQLSVCFKQAPQQIDGEKEQLMIAYMRTVYERIRNYEENLKDDNHIVYIARPSGWVKEETKELYRQMALKAGIPLGGLTSESRAAIFYALSPNVGFAKEVSQGAIVFDLGSSTLDFTYLKDDDQNPIDFGYNLGASVIEQTIYEKLIYQTEGVDEFVANYPQYVDALRFQARLIKEEAYSKDPETRTLVKFSLDKVMSEECEDIEKYEDVDVKIKFKNVNELNELIENGTTYISRMKESIIDYRDNHIRGKKVHGVFLTGGASRMNFIIPLITEVFNLSETQVKIDGDNPSLTISRGIASLGVADAVTDMLVAELENKIPSVVNTSELQKKLIAELSEEISDSSWKAVESACLSFKTSQLEKSLEMKDLESKIRFYMDLYKEHELPRIISNVFNKFLKDESENVRIELNKIISYYAPGREIKSVAMNQISGSSAINNELNKMAENIAEICAKNTTSTIGKVLWAALGIFLWGVFAVLYYAIKGVINYFRSEESKRKDLCKKIEEKELEIKTNVSMELEKQLAVNNEFTSVVSSNMKDYFNKLVKENIKQVRIPIE